MGFNGACAHRAVVSCCELLSWHCDASRASFGVTLMMAMTMMMMMMVTMLIPRTDIGYQSSDLADVTPNMNRLASEGVTIDWYYSATTCTPARAALHTGVHWARSGMWWGDVASDTPFALGVRTPTLAERLRRHGYRTHLVGKWDVGHSNASYWPTNRGFDSFYGLFGAEYGNYTTHESYRDRYYTVYDLVQVDAALAPVVGEEAGIASSSASVSSAPRFDKRLGYATNIFRDRTIEVRAESARAGPYRRRPQHARGTARTTCPCTPCEPRARDGGHGRSSRDVS